MKARVTIEYEPDWPEGLSLQELRDREEQAWMTMHVRPHLCGGEV
jgi:hypothetical protein